MRQIIFVAAFLLASTIQAQVKEGFVKYKTTLANSEAGDLGAAMLGNSSLSIYFKNEKSLTEMSTPLYTIKTLTDSKGTLMLMDGASEKMFTRTPPETKSKGVDPAITITNEKKKILGYDCVKAIVTAKDKNGNGVTTTLWYTDKIVTSVPLGFVSQEVLQKIKGLPLEINLSQGPVQSKVTASEISVKPVPDAVFSLSTAGYTERKASVGRGKNR